MDVEDHHCVRRAERLWGEGPGTSQILWSKPWAVRVAGVRQVKLRGDRTGPAAPLRSQPLLNTSLPRNQAFSPSGVLQPSISSEETCLLSAESSDGERSSGHSTGTLQDRRRGPVELDPQTPSAVERRTQRNVQLGHSRKASPVQPTVTSITRGPLHLCRRSHHHMLPTAASVPGLGRLTADTISL